LDASAAVPARCGVEAVVLHTEADLQWLAFCRERLAALAPEPSAGTPQDT
jgi:hypothetical protein